MVGLKSIREGCEPDGLPHDVSDVIVDVILIEAVSDVIVAGFMTS